MKKRYIVMTKITQKANLINVKKDKKSTRESSNNGT